MAAAILTSWQFAISVVGGAGIAIFATIASLVLFRRMPTVLASKKFYRLIWINEGLKWIVVISVSILLLPYVEPLGMLIGFMITYSGYFWLMYTGRGS